MNTCLAHRGGLALGLLLAVVSALSAADGDHLRTRIPTRHALLVGVSRYPSLPETAQLPGPANDVLLIRDLLVKKFCFANDPASLVILSEAAGKSDPARLPTRAAIEREFRRLARVVGREDQVVILLAGHGSQQPSLAQALEPDHLDEIFLPRDIGRWDGSQGGVQNAIKDKEVAQWLAAIETQGAYVWVLFDCCHAGDMTRGIGDRERTVRPDDEQTLGIPAAIIEQARRREPVARAGARGTPGARDGDSASASRLAGRKRLAALYACQAHERTIERSFSDGESCGLLTHSVVAVLGKAASSLSYRELCKRVYEQYLAQGRTYGPTPLLEGGAAAQCVLGTEELSRPNISVIRDPRSGGLQVDAGRIHGLTEGSVLAVYPPPGEAASPASAAQGRRGFVRVAEIRTTSAVVEPCEHQGEGPASRQAILGGRCEVVEIDYGEQRLTVALDSRDARGQSLPPETARLVEQALETVARDKGTLIRRSDDCRTAAWLLRVAGEALWLVPAAEAVRAEASEASGLVRPSPNAQPVGTLAESRSLAAVLGARLRHIARAENLLRLAADGAGDSPGAAARHGIRVQMRVRRVEGDAPGELTPPVNLRAGDRLEILLANRGAKAVDVTLLYVDSGYGIEGLFPAPDRNENNRIEPGQELVPLPIRVGPTTVGCERFVLIAVPAAGTRMDFSHLAQTTLVQARRVPARRSALLDLLHNAMYAEGGARSAPPKAVDDYWLEVFAVMVQSK